MICEINVYIYIYIATNKWVCACDGVPGHVRAHAPIHHV